MRLFYLHDIVPFTPLLFHLWIHPWSSFPCFWGVICKETTETKKKNKDFSSHAISPWERRKNTQKTRNSLLTQKARKSEKGKEKTSRDASANEGRARLEVATNWWIRMRLTMEWGPREKVKQIVWSGGQGTIWQAPGDIMLQKYVFWSMIRWHNNIRAPLMMSFFTALHEMPKWMAQQNSFSV